MTKAAASQKREYKTPESASRQKKQWEAKGYTVTRRGNVLYLRKKGG
jgi:hypothetical protein